MEWEERKRSSSFKDLKWDWGGLLGEYCRNWVTWVSLRFCFKMEVKEVENFVAHLCSLSRGFLLPSSPLPLSLIFLPRILRSAVLVMCVVKSPDPFLWCRNIWNSRFSKEKPVSSDTPQVTTWIGKNGMVMFGLSCALIFRLRIGATLTCFRQLKQRSNQILLVLP